MAMFKWSRMLVRVLCAAGLVASVGSAAVAAENPVLATAYGTGVHAYFAGDYQRTYDDLTTVIEGGANDPRAYYFRGLAALKLGRFDEADTDFAAGAAREAAALGTWNVPRSLERIQGEDRLRLERHRSRARVVLAQQRREALARRYAEIDGEQESVLRRRRPETVPARKAGPIPEKAEESETEDQPFDDEDAKPEMAEEAPAEEEAAEEEAAEEESGEDANSPFGDDAPASDKTPAADETEPSNAEEEEADPADPASDDDATK